MTYKIVTINRSSMICFEPMHSSIPLSMENKDCVQFLKDWKAGATVTNADGSPAPYSDDAVRALGLEPV